MDCKKGSGRLEIQKEEQGTINFAFCTLTTKTDLKKGHIICENDLIAKRPNIGDYLSEDIPNLIGMTLTKNINQDEKLFRHHFE